MFSIPDSVILLAANSKRLDTSVLLTAKIQEGWNLVRDGEFHWRDESDSGGGHSLDCHATPIQRSGVGKSAEEAMTVGLCLALRRVGNSFHAARVEEILMKEYPWFFVARVTVRPYGTGSDAEMATVRSGTLAEAHHDRH